MVRLLWRPLSYSLSVFYFLTRGNVPQIEPALNYWLFCWLPVKPFTVSSLLLALVGRGGPPQNIQSVGEPCTSTKLDVTEFFPWSHKTYPFGWHWEWSWYMYVSVCLMWKMSFQSLKCLVQSQSQCLLKPHFPPPISSALWCPALKIFFSIFPPRSSGSSNLSAFLSRHVF